MTLPDAVRTEVEQVLGPVRSAAPVGGGCVSEAVRVTTDVGAAFVKHDTAAPAGMFEAEAEGLAALRGAGADVCVPEVLGRGDRWIALEWIETAPRAAASDERLGGALAAIHRTAGADWGWRAPGFIGPLAQDNERSENWPAFWAGRRLEPRLRAARDAGAEVGGSADWARLFAALPGVLAAASVDGPSLVHGDLWSGNALATGDGRPVLIDPAAYQGHREVDLAMAELFGGFSPAFRGAYQDAWPLEPGYDEVRRGTYQLYYLLVHVNLFGGSYAAQTRELLGRVLAAL